MTDYLHLDSISGFRGVIKEYQDHDPGFFKAEILSRIFLIVHSVLFVALGSVKQATRGLSLLFSGYVTFALKDFLSILVQAVVLPILGILCILSPTEVRNKALNIEYKVNTGSWLQGVSYTKADGPQSLIHANEVTQRIDGLSFTAQILLRITSVIQMINYFVLGFLQNLLTFNVSHEQLLLVPYLCYHTFHVVLTFEGGTWNTLRAHGLRIEKAYVVMIRYGNVDQSVGDITPLT